MDRKGVNELIETLNRPSVCVSAIYSLYIAVPRAATCQDMPYVFFSHSEKRNITAGLMNS